MTPRNSPLALIGRKKNTLNNNIKRGNNNKNNQNINPSNRRRSIQNSRILHIRFMTYKDIISLPRDSIFNQHSFIPKTWGIRA